jgi:hypothetical protein
LEIFQRPEAKAEATKDKVALQEATHTIEELKEYVKKLEEQNDK